jgi:ketosteroid isomerase-like protein
MSTRSEILELEEQLRQAELGPDPAFFERALADDIVFAGQKGQPPMTKAYVVQAHQPKADGPIFTRVEMIDMEIVEHGDAAAVVMCKGTYEGPSGTITLGFMRVWLKRDGRWQIIAVAMTN